MPGARQADAGFPLAGRYRLAELLRMRDGSAEWRAVDEALSRPVTVYVMAAGSSPVAEAMAAARAVSRLNDPRLVRVFDADDRADPPFIVTGWPHGVPLAGLLSAGPVDPWRAVGVIAEAAGALAGSHEGGLAHLCLDLDSVWCGPGGEVTVTGLGIAAALTAARATDPAVADAGALARLLYAVLTGYRPAAEPASLPAAPRHGGLVCRPGRLRPGIPAAIDAVTCRALPGQAGDGEPPILSPAQLAKELGALLAPGSPPPVPPLPAEGTRPLAGQTRPRARGLPAKLTAILVVVAAALAAGAWLAAREMTAPHHPAAVTARPLAPVSAAAFGPRGEHDGDNPQLARLAIDGSLTTAWHTHWYTTARFGNLQQGTGLLLDMGRPVTITAARITLGPNTGADLQLRVGGQPAPAALRPVARAAGAGGVVTIRLTTRASGGYLLIWFSKLPPDNSGTFQASIYGIRLDGTT